MNEEKMFRFFLEDQLWLMLTTCTSAQKAVTKNWEEIQKLIKQG